MTFLLFKNLPAWGMALSLVMNFAAGVGLGTLYFRIIWWNARLFASGGRAALSFALPFIRFALLAGFLTLASFEGALPLLLLTLGILGARVGVMRRVRRAMP